MHEAYLRLVEDQDQQWDSRGHFFSAAAEAVRRILVENARRKNCVKHGGSARRVDLENLEACAPERSLDILTLDETLDRFAAEAPARAELVKLRYFAGLTLEQAAEVLGISRATAARYWTYARAWLYEALAGQEEEK